MVISARTAGTEDVDLIEIFYRGLAAEMDALRPLWSAAEGLTPPVASTLALVLRDPSWFGYIGAIDDVPVGFLLGRDEPLLPQDAERSVGAIRFIYTIPEAREVGVGEAMMDSYLEDAATRGVTLFDAHVSPGHRESKNFFESHGFSARSIVMHRGSS